MEFFQALWFTADNFALIIDVGQRGQCRINVFQMAKTLLRRCGGKDVHPKQAQNAT